MLSEVKTRLDEGMNVREIAEDLGTSDYHVVRTLQALGIERGPNGRYSHRSLRRRISDMPATKAVEYLLDIVEELTGTSPQDLTRIWSLGIRGQEAQAFAFLLKRGQATHEEILTAIAVDHADPPELKQVQVIISRLRKKLKGTQYRLQTMWGVGYRLEVQEVDC